jgi:hypothetical protein
VSAKSLHTGWSMLICGFSGALRNAAPEFQGMSLSEDDVAALAAFLASLTEDYDDA